MKVEKEGKGRLAIIYKNKTYLEEQLFENKKIEKENSRMI